MSLILDALKKSEAERQRHTGPTLLDVRIARPQRRYPIWAFVLGGLLLVNMVLLLVFVLRHPSGETILAAAGPAPAPSAGALGPITQPAVPPATVPPAPASSAAPSQPTMDSHLPPVNPPASGAATPTLTDEEAEDSSANPADEAPALSPAQQPAGGSVKYQRDDSGGYASLPSYSEIGGNMPPLRLDLHVYSERPHDRYAMINMQAVHEGDTLSEGMRVLAITRDGVALDYRGRQFVLHPQ